MKVLKASNELFEMAMPRKAAMERVEKYNKEITSHIIKCVVYPNSRDLDHWIKEIANLCQIINNAEMKSSHPKFKYNEYKDLVFGYFGDTLKDCNNALEDFYYEFVHYKNLYPEFEITKELVLKLYKLISNLSRNIIDVFVTKNDKDRKDFEFIIREDLEKLAYHENDC